ncbi:MAG: hypothetical protein KAT71_08040 [Gammaproteobacteria bacterium]|nr:hypothetical protein [Gammaproteobacteria bacterium]
MTNIDTIKIKAKAILQELVNSGLLHAVESDVGVDLLKGPRKYPVAMIGSTVIGTARHASMCEVDRTYTMPVTVVFNNAGKKNSMDDNDRVVEQIMDEFDKRITMDGTLQTGWLEPSTTMPYGFESAKDKIAVDIVLVFHTIRDMGGFAGQ